MQQRTLGRTGHSSSVVIFGAVAFWDIDQDTANRTLDFVLEHSINHIDVAPGYRDAQARTGPWLQHHRDEFFLGCKTAERTREAAWADLRNSLDLLRTDHFDLYQLHAIGTMEELDQAFAPGGVMETLIEAREQGLTRWLGITGHGMDTPRVHLEALNRFDFDTVMFPINAKLLADATYKQDVETLLAAAKERNVGTQIIKSLAKAPWAGRAKTYGPWYEPFDQYDQIEPAVHFALSQPVTAIVSSGDVRLLPMIFQAAEHFTPMSAAEQAAMIEQHARDEAIFEGVKPLWD